MTGTSVALDTNIWIYLTKETFFELWVRLKEMKENGEINIIINNVIMMEWERNKGNTIRSLAESIKNEYKSALNLYEFLNEDVRETYLDIISNYKESAKRIESATKRVEEVEAFMKSCEIIEVTETQIMFIAKCAIEKLPPFTNNKNNFNDALILRNIYEYTESKFPQKYDLIYVSNNPDDFIDKNTGMVHGSLFEGLEAIGLKNVRELGEALRLAPELIDNFDEWLDTQLDNEAMYQLDIMRGK